MWKQEVNLGCRPQALFIFVVVVVEERALRLGWLASKPQRTSCLFLPSAGITNMPWCIDFWGGRGSLETGSLLIALAVLELFM